MQFSAWNGDKGDRRNLQRAMIAPDTDPILQQCLGAWVWAKNEPDPTNGATHYVAKSIPEPYWAKDATMTLETDKFRFYAGVK
jgi:hypothetical protein